MFGGDDVSDVGRILAVARTVNMKTEGGRVPVPSALINGGSNASYTIDQLKGWAPPLATSKSQAAHKKERKPRAALRAHEWLDARGTVPYQRLGSRRIPRRPLEWPRLAGVARCALPWL